MDGLKFDMANMALQNKLQEAGKMTKQELTLEINNILKEYLQCGDVNFKTNLSKPQLEKQFQAYKQMITIKRQAEELVKGYTDQQKLCAGMTGTDENYLKYCELLKQAQQIYWTDFRKEV